jgi:hypothetical protein
MLIRTITQMVEAAIERAAQWTTICIAMAMAGIVIALGESVRGMLEPAAPQHYVPKRERGWARRAGRLLQWINEGADAVARAIQTRLGPKTRQHTRQYETLRSIARGKQGYQGDRNRLIVWWLLAQWIFHSPWPRRERMKSLAGALAMTSIIVMAQDQREESATRVKFDTDSTRIGIDNR